MPDTSDSRLADVAYDSCVNGQFYGSRGIHLMINNNPGRRGTRRSRHSALLLIVGTEGPDHGLLEVIHEVSRGALNVCLCFGSVTAVNR